jgi:hypothetical protein
VALFFIDTGSGAVATQRQLIDAGIADQDGQPPKPWHLIRASNDATTLWHAVLRKRTRGIFIGTLVLRHSPHHASLLADGWEEIGMDELRANPSPGGSGSGADTRLAARTAGDRGTDSQAM